MKEPLWNGKKAVIYAEAKLGELLKGMPPRAPIGFAQGNRMSLPPGISKRTSHQAQTIAANPEAVEDAISRAIERGLCCSLCKFFRGRCRTTALFLSHNCETRTKLEQELTMNYGGLRGFGLKGLSVILSIRQLQGRFLGVAPC